MPANDKEAHVPIWFTLKIGGAEAAGFFKEATGFDSESPRSPRSSGRCPTGATDVIKAMGNTKWGDIELKRGVDQDKTLWNWRKLIVDGKLKDARKDCTDHDARLRGLSPSSRTRSSTRGPRSTRASASRPTRTRSPWRASRSATRASRSSKEPDPDTP